MKQVPRRIAYFLLGAIPALMSAFVSLFTDAGYSVNALVLGFGMLVAMFSRFPVRTRVYWITTACLLIGLVSAIPMYEMFVKQGLFLAFHRSRLTGLGVADLVYMLKIIWFFCGPIVCAAHYIFRARSLAEDIDGNRVRN